MQIRNFVFASAVLAASPAFAAGSSNYIALLNAGQEVPSNSSTGFGVAFITFDKTTGMLCPSVTTSGLTGTETAAHIHGPAAVGVNAAVLFALPTGNPKAGCVGPLDKDQAKALKKSELYINVHSTLFPGGEIRGQIVPSAK